MAVPMHALYAASVKEFLAKPPESVVGALVTRALVSRGSAEPQQAQAWIDEVTLLHRALRKLPKALSWGLLLEYSLRRLGRCPDAVLLAPGVIVVIEFKMGALRHSGSYTDQAVDYVRCIRDFHGSARECIVVPIVCAERAPSHASHTPMVVHAEAKPILSNATDLWRDLQVAASLANAPRALSWQAFDSGPYIPTPSIIEAAQAIFAGHTVAEIGRADADGASRKVTARRLRYWVSLAQRRKRHVICMVTGTPGSGKSLLGLNLALSKDSRRSRGQPAALLTGNKPLVHVLTKAIIRDAKKRGKYTADTERALDGALQTLQGYLRQHTGKRAALPPERVIVFDEAQRAWDAKTGKKLFKRAKSEPALFLEILRRLDWACLVCLIGVGQEINVGEGGVKLWEMALEKEAKGRRPWHIVCADSELLRSKHLRVDVDPALHLSGHIRAYRNPLHIEWVDALLSGNILRATQLAKEIRPAPAMMTRDLEIMRRWLTHWRGSGRRVGLLASSAASVRLRADNIQAPPTSAELPEIERWFLDTHPDFSSSDSLEIPLSEFGCQGLELDVIGLAWGGDFIWSAETSNWVPRKMRASEWIYSHDDGARFRVNSYRVLLTRAREGLCIFVPMGCDGDPTRSPTELNEIAQTLKQAGCRELLSMRDVSTACEPNRSTMPPTKSPSTEGPSHDC